MTYGRRQFLRDWLVRATTISLAVYFVANLVVRSLVTPVAAQHIGVQGLLAMLALATGGAVAFGWIRHRESQVRQFTDLALEIASGGTTRPLDVRRDDVWGRLGVAFNQMARMTSERQSRTQEAINRLETVLSAMVEGVLAVDGNHRILFANRAAGRLLGFNVASATGKKIVEVSRNRQLLDALHEALGDSKKRVKRESIRYEIDSPHSHGQILSLRANPIPGGADAGVLIVLQDVTELRRLESLRQEFVANVSHELKTPLTAIKAYTETLQQGAIHDSTISLQFLSQIEVEADRLHTLILDLLQLARVESGQQTFEIEPILVADAVDASLLRFRGAAQAKAIDLSAEGSQDRVVVLADEEALREILDNLIDNAVKYTPDGGRVLVHWLNTASEAIIRVSDTGIGIPPESLPRVFERFYRVDRARSRELGSTGLGLSIVKHLVQALGGSIEVESKVQVGTTFAIRLPSGVPAPPEDVNAPISAQD